MGGKNDIHKVVRDGDGYSIGLDLGTASVGWCVVNARTAGLCYFKGKPLWGSRLFPSADTAASTRVKRGQRRRYNRRRQRIQELQSVFATIIEPLDPDFFIRMNLSRLVKDDRNGKGLADVDYRFPFFNGCPVDYYDLETGQMVHDDHFTDITFHRAYPTVWHLRRAVMDAPAAMDARLVYLALHNIAKCRGNFLYQEQGEALKGANANTVEAIEEFKEALDAYLDSFVEDDEEDSGTDVNHLGYDSLTWNMDSVALRTTLEEPRMRRDSRAESIATALGFSSSGKNLAKLLGKAIVGYSVDFSKLFPGVADQGVESLKFSLSDEDTPDAFSEVLSDEAHDYFEALRKLNSAYVLVGVLRGHTSISDAFIDQYEQHAADLKVVKGLVKDYLGRKAYDEMFRGELDDRGDYDINELKKNTYTGFIAGEKLANKKGTTQEELVKALHKLLSSNEGIVADERYSMIKDRLESDDPFFLARQKSRANGAIPYQLHVEELRAIIRNQGAFYPELAKSEDHLAKVVGSRIPYYVGPLNGGHDPEGYYAQNACEDKSRRFAWSVRRPGMEHVKAFPWNVDEVIDTDESAERFIRRMTGTCTYLYGKPVVPRCSLLYEEFCVLNELNGARWARNANAEPHRFDAKDREGIVHDVFGTRKGVSYRAVQDWLLRNHGDSDARVSGGQGETGFESKLSSNRDFCLIFGVDDLDDAPLTRDEIEQIILWSTVFEDREIYSRKVRESFGDRLTPKQVEDICRKRYRGWGRLSREFLDGEVFIDTWMGKRTIMDVLRDGSPLEGDRCRAMILQEIITDSKLGFGERIDAINREYFEETDLMMQIDQLPGSPALRRTVNQAMRILDELIGIAGTYPASICIEETRGEDKAKKGKRTTRRYDQVRNAYADYEGQVREQLQDELDRSKDLLDDKRLMLYFLQMGKCLYSGETLDINRLAEYQVDHILPQCYIKDDSFDNLALVKAEHNQRKLDSMLLANGIINAQGRWWKQLHEAKLMSDKKYANLTRRELRDNQIRGFINRQLVETSQIVKYVRQMCAQQYPESKVTTIRASLSHGLREHERCHFVKCREINDFHHAHDAFLACQMAHFVAVRYPSWEDGIDVSFIKKAIEKQGEESNGRINPADAGFLVSSFCRDGIDLDTGELIWDAEGEISRIRRTLNLQHCYISRMVEEQTGAFWDETVYSPRDKSNGKNLPVPLKSSGQEGELAPSVYGGKQNVRMAYSFIFAAKDKKGNWKYFFEGIPIYVARSGRSSSCLLQEHARMIASSAGCSNPVILREKVPFRQLLELSGSPYYLGGRSNGGNFLSIAKQHYAPDMVAEAISSMISGTDSEKEFTSIILPWIEEVLEDVSPEKASVVKLREARDRINGLDQTAKRKLLQDLLSFVKGETDAINLSIIGGSKAMGALKRTLASSLGSIVFVNISITGVFESRQSFKDLTRGL